MKFKTWFCLVFLSIFVSGLYANERGPVAISPGSDVGIAVVGMTCPTFSWTTVDWASAYRVEVFEALTPEVVSHDQMAASAYPVLSKEIQGRALSWTPSSDEQLRNGATYVWYVQAMDAYGTAKWSEGRMFRVEMDDRLGLFIDKVTERLKEAGVSADIIGEVLKDLSSEAMGSNIGSESTKGKGYTTSEPIKIQGNESGTNTWYGEHAGASLTIGYYNTFMGYYAGNKTTSGYYNTFIGQGAGRNNDSGSSNTFIGVSAGYYNLTGNSNIFVGLHAGSDNTGSDNTCLGYYAGGANTGNYNIFLGSQAGYNNNADNNMFVGTLSGYWNTTGNQNTFFGHLTGYTNTDGSENTFLGHQSGYFNDGGGENTFVGYRSGYNNTMGTRNTFLGNNTGFENDEGNENTYVGWQAGLSNTNGAQNTFVGRSTGEGNTTGGGNTFLGHFAGYGNTTGSESISVGRSAGYKNNADNNTFIGSGAGYNNTTGSSNIFIGYLSGYSEVGSHRLYIENSDTNSPLIYGEFDNDIVAINGKLGVGTQSPAYDLEVETTGKNAVFLLDRTDGAKAGYAAYGDKALLGTVTNHPLMFAVGYAWKMRLNTDSSLVMANGAQCTAGGVWQNASSRNYKESIRDLTVDESREALFDLNPVRYTYKNDAEDEHLGFIAEDVPELVASKDRKGMSPMDVVAVLTKVVQEQQATLREQQAALQEQQAILKVLQETISTLQKRIARVENKSQLN